MIHTDGRRTIAQREVDSFTRTVANADAFVRTLAEIEALPTFDENADWEDEHRYDHDEIDPPEEDE